VVMCVNDGNGDGSFLAELQVVFFFFFVADYSPCGQ
jgi:hypothetical protein